EREQRLQLRGEGEPALLVGPVEGLDAEPVAGAEEPALGTIVEREGEHAVELRQRLRALPREEAQENLGVGMVGGEALAALLEHLPERRSVVDLAVENEDEAAVRRRHRLPPAGDVDDREPPHPEREKRVPVAPDALAVGAAMSDGLVHRADPGFLLRAMDP